MSLAGSLRNTAQRRSDGSANIHTNVCRLDAIKMSCVRAAGREATGQKKLKLCGAFASRLEKFVFPCSKYYSVHVWEAI